MASIQGLHTMDALRTVEQIQLLDLVDSLRAEGLSEFTALPQLVVCGDQSSGKSSLLEAISGVPFPRKDNLCTRFATEVILRRATNSEIRVSLVSSLSYLDFAILKILGRVGRHPSKTGFGSFGMKSPPQTTLSHCLSKPRMLWVFYQLAETHSLKTFCGLRSLGPRGHSSPS
jgi:hypothetical protein